MKKHLLLLLLPTTLAQITLRTYPPSAATSASTTVSGAGYGSGVYSFSESNSFNSTTTAWRTFDRSSSTMWLSGSFYPSGNYNGSASLLEVQGEWIQVSLPVNITLVSYSISCFTSPSYLCPSGLSLFGSNDSTTWAQLSNVSLISGWTSNSTFNYSVSLSAPLANFSSFRFVFSSATVGSGDQIAISELLLTGVECMFLIITDKKYLLYR